jgi:hypothetical protein
VVIADASQKYKQLDLAATDGADIAVAVLLQDADAADADVEDALLLKRHATVALNKLIWPDGITDAQKANALAQLEAAGIIAQQGA